MGIEIKSESPTTPPPPKNPSVPSTTPEGRLALARAKFGRLITYLNTFTGDNCKPGYNPHFYYTEHKLPSVKRLLATGNKNAVDYVLDVLVENPDVSCGDRNFTVAEEEIDDLLTLPTKEDLEKLQAKADGVKAGVINRRPAGIDLAAGAGLGE